ncbi:choline transporter [Apiospora arundinis]
MSAILMQKLEGFQKDLRLNQWEKSRSRDELQNMKNEMMQELTISAPLFAGFGDLEAACVFARGVPTTVEVRQPATQVPKAMVLTVVINTFAGLLFMIPLVFVLPDIQALLASNLVSLCLSSSKVQLGLLEELSGS